MIEDVNNKIHSHTIKDKNETVAHCASRSCTPATESSALH